MAVGAATPERVNASTLLDSNLEAGRAGEVALLLEEGTVRYAELARLTGGVARWLLALGVEREQRVLMILDDSPAFVATFLGAMRIGAVPVPVNLMDRLDNFAYYLDDSYASVLVVDDELVPKLESILAKRPEVQVVVVGGDGDGYPSFEDSVSPAVGELPPPASTHRDDMAFWLYSSGSTGRPKGVVHRHEDIRVTVDTYARQVLRISSEDVCYSTTKLFHAYGLGNSLSFPLSVGACSVLVRGRSLPDRIFETVQRCQPTLFFSVPALYAAMLKAPGVGEVDFSCARTCVSAAEALPSAVLERWRDITGVPILDGIGSTEMLHIYCSNTLEDLTPGTSGRPVPGYELRIVDEKGHDAAPGEAGDLLVQGASCAAAYWHQIEKTRHCMRGEWFYTGDRYAMTADGCYAYQGRADDMIKVGGLWVSPADVEACLVRHSAVSEAAVIGVQVEDVSRIKAFVIGSGDRSAGLSANVADRSADPEGLADELRRWCKSNLRRYEYPHFIEFVDDLPRTPTGKVQRYKLREAEAARAAALGPRGVAGAAEG
jgi:benzoate-CoA ligase